MGKEEGRRRKERKEEGKEKKAEWRPISIHLTTSLSFTIIALVAMMLLGYISYRAYVSRAKEISAQNARQLLNQVSANLEDYLRNMRRISDAMYYSVIKDKDLSYESLSSEMNLLYEANKDKLVSVACFEVEDGSLLGAAPVATAKEGMKVWEQEWFYKAAAEPENFHYTISHVQNLFENPNGRYYWVISLSREVELTKGGASSRGVLLVDMNYRSISQQLGRVNTDSTAGYVYLMDQEGNLIYHPRQQLIAAGEERENRMEVFSYEDDSFLDHLDGKERIVTVKTVPYTGWKLVNVIEVDSFSLGLRGTRYMMVLIISLSMLAIIVLNQVVSWQITKPLRLLLESVRDWEDRSDEPNIYVGGPLEVERLGETLRSSVARSRELMRDIVVEQEEKRKSELDALQSQINPHFLYNTLDSIIWMISAGRGNDAIYMTKQLASLFRISLSKGKTIISIKDELTHARTYMNIQQVRYKNGFAWRFEVEEEIEEYCIVKLVLQPLLENAIYYGMEIMEDEGEILVRGYKSGEDIVLRVEDNGPGVPAEVEKSLLLDTGRKRSRGSGVGLLNVHRRLLLRFGEGYGLTLDNRPDEGFAVEIRIPAIPATGENLERLESGREGGKR